MVLTRERFEGRLDLDFGRPVFQAQSAVVLVLSSPSATHQCMVLRVA